MVPSLSASLNYKPRNPSPQISLQLLFNLFQHLPKQTRLPPLRGVTSRARTSVGKAMLPALTIWGSRNAVQKWEVSAMARSRSAMGSVDR